MKLLEYTKNNRLKLIKTVFCYLTFLCYGSSYTLLGSTLLDLQIRLVVPFAKVSSLVPARSTGILIGGLISGFTDALLGPDMVLCLTTVTSGLFMAIAPWFKIFNGVYVCLFLAGVTQGIFEIYVNICVLSTWNDKASNYVQILHGTFGLGSLLAPLVARPFLLPLAQNSNETEDESDLAILGDYTPDDVKVQYPYLMIGFLLIVSSCGFLFFHFKNKSSKKKDQKTEDNDTQDKHPTWKKFLAVLCVSFIAHATFSIEAIIGSLAPAFAVKSDLKMSKQNGADLVTMFWTVFTFYRIFFINMKRFTKEKYIMFFNCALTLTSVLLMCLYASHNRIYAWISFILLGIGISPAFSVSLGLLQKYTPMSNKYASFLFIFGAIGESSHPWINAKIMDTIPEIFVYHIALLSVIQVFFILLLPPLCKKLFKVEAEVEAPLDRFASIRSNKLDKICRVYENLCLTARSWLKFPQLSLAKMTSPLTDEWPEVNAEEEKRIKIELIKPYHARTFMKYFMSSRGDFKGKPLIVCSFGEQTVELNDLTIDNTGVDLRERVERHFGQRVGPIVRAHYTLENSKDDESISNLLYYWVALSLNGTTKDEQLASTSINQGS